jgi:hypothetical protein
MLRLYNPRPPERISWPWTVGTLSAYAFALLVLVWLAIANPKMSVWMSQAAEAELAAQVPPTAESLAFVPAAQMGQPEGSMQSSNLSIAFTGSLRPPLQQSDPGHLPR